MNYTKKIRKDEILLILRDHTAGFSEIGKKLNLKDAQIDRLLKELVKEQLVKKIIDSNKPVYSLTKNGEETVKAIPIIQDSIESILSVKHTYSNKMGKFSPGYKGINFDLLSDVQVNAELSRTFEKIVEECFKKSENTIAEIPSIIGDKSELKGKMVLALTIDFDDMREQFQNRKNRTWKKFGLKWENEKDWENLFSGDDTK